MNATLSKIKEAKIQVLGELKAQMKEEAVEDILEGALKDESEVLLSPDVREAFQGAANASKKFINEKLVQKIDKRAVPPSLLPGLAVVAVFCLLVGVLIFKKSKRNKNAQRRLFLESPPASVSAPSAASVSGAGSSRTPSVSPWNNFAMSERVKPSDKLK